MTYPDLETLGDDSDEEELADILADEWQREWAGLGEQDADDDDEDLLERYSEQARALAKPRWLELLRNRGEGDWMDVDGSGTGRREGALAFLGLVSRCHWLETLDLSVFDSGNTSMKEPDPHSSLPSLRKLTLFQVERAARHLMLLRTPNPQQLEIFVPENYGVEPDPPPSFADLDVLFFSCLSDANLPLLLDLFVEGVSVLRKLTIHTTPKSSPGHLNSSPLLSRPCAEASVTSSSPPPSSSPPSPPPPSPSSTSPATPPTLS